MKFVESIEEIVELENKADVLFNLVGYPDLTADTFFKINYFKQGFSSFHCIFFNGLFDNKEEHEKLVDFLKQMGESKFYILAYSNFNTHIEKNMIEGEVTDSYESYSAVLRENGSENETFKNVSMIADFTLFWGETNTWAMVHDRYNDNVLIALQHLEDITKLKELYKRKLHSIEGAISYVEKLHGTQLNDDILTRLRNWYPEMIEH